MDSTITHTFQFLEQTLHLHPHRAFYWEDERALVLSDVHLGKSGHFRKSGIAVPVHLAEKDLALIEKLIQKWQPVKILIIGDLFHSKHNREFDLFAQWRANHADIEVVLVRGNHDVIPSIYYKNANVKVYLSKLEIGPFLFVHEPPDDYNGPLYVISGHLHPAIRLQGKGRQSLVLPCFYFGRGQGFLPAFGHFTGSAVIKAYTNDHIFAIAGNEIRKLSV